MAQKRLPPCVCRFAGLEMSPLLTALAAAARHAPVTPLCCEHTARKLRKCCPVCPDTNAWPDPHGARRAGRTQLCGRRHWPARGPLRPGTRRLRIWKERAGGDLRAGGWEESAPIFPTSPRTQNTFPTSLGQIFEKSAFSLESFPPAPRWSRRSLWLLRHRFRKPSAWCFPVHLAHLGTDRSKRHGVCRCPGSLPHEPGQG